MKSVIILIVIFSIAGCSGLGYIYYDKDLKKIPLEQLSRMSINAQVRNLQIDGIKVGSVQYTKKALSPGEYLFEYELKKELDGETDLDRQMREDGYTKDSDGMSYTKYDSESGHYSTLTPSAKVMRRNNNPYEWIKKSQNVRILIVVVVVYIILEILEII